MPNKLTALARNILAVEADLPYRIDRERERATVEDYEFHVFAQTWGSTALGFGGIGGQAMTTAYTVVCVPLCVDQKCHVYFGGRYAYGAEPSAILPLKCYIYCTKPLFPHEDFLVFDAGTNKVKAFYGGGKVIGEFVCHNIFPISFYASESSFFDTEPPMDVPGTCLTDKEIAEYLGNGKTGYGWLISDLVIYDEPKELSEFGVNRAPQSWRFINDSDKRI